jgi:iron complex transport system permease protein
MPVATRTAGWSAGLTGVLVAAMAGSALVGPVPLSHGDVALSILDALPFLAFDVADTARTIVVTVRLPRIVLAAGVGFALASAGAVMQGFFRNPMADPSIIGVSSGAAVGAVATIALGLEVPYGLQAAAFVGGVVSAFAVYVIASEGGRTPVATLLLAGVAIQTFLGAVISYMLLQAGESLERAVVWLMGHLHHADWGDVEAVALTVPPLFLLLLTYGRDLNVMLLGEEDAHTLGVEVERTSACCWRSPRWSPPPRSPSPASSGSSVSSSRTCCASSSGPTTASCCRRAPSRGRPSSSRPTRSPGRGPRRSRSAS